MRRAGWRRARAESGTRLRPLRRAGRVGAAPRRRRRRRAGCRPRGSCGCGAAAAQAPPLHLPAPSCACKGRCTAAVMRLSSPFWRRDARCTSSPLPQERRGAAPTRRSGGGRFRAALQLAARSARSPSVRGLPVSHAISIRGCRCLADGSKSAARGGVGRRDGDTGARLPVRFLRTALPLCAAESGCTSRWRRRRSTPAHLCRIPMIALARPLNGRAPVA